MKQEDFDRLKAVCEKEGFELCYEWPTDGDKLFVVKKAKDIWENVEFVQNVHSDNIHPCNRIINYKNLLNWRPSTESAYTEQLKSEAFKRFGEIKEGDSFESPNIKINSLLGKRSNKEWDYFKKDDQFFYYDLEVYSKGKWATRVKERVKVDFSWFIDGNNRPLFNFHSLDANPIKSVLEEKTSSELKNIGEFLASKLEEYLNKD